MDHRDKEELNSPERKRESAGLGLQVITIRQKIQNISEQSRFTHKVNKSYRPYKAFLVEATCTCVKWPEGYRIGLSALDQTSGCQADQDVAKNEMRTSLQSIRFGYDHIVICSSFLTFNDVTKLCYENWSRNNSLNHK